MDKLFIVVPAYNEAQNMGESFEHYKYMMI